MKSASSVKPLLSVIILILLDQIIKIVIYNFYLDSRFQIIPGLLDFHPKFNQYYSYMNERLNNYDIINLSLIYHIIFIIIMEFIIIFLYRNAKKRNIITQYMKIGFIFFQAGYICALIGYFWKEGCLDYIYLKPLFIFDLKDIYIFLFVSLFIFHSIKIVKKYDKCA